MGTTKQRGSLDLEREPGAYFVPVDGHYFATGAWSLDVFVVP